jgi:hypothetical protein
MIDALEECVVLKVADSSTLGLFGFATGIWISATVLGG